MKNELKNKLQKALEEDNSLATPTADIASFSGCTTSYMAYLGLDERDLKRLERAGACVRGRLPTKKGHQLRWIFIKEACEALLRQPQQTGKESQTDQAPLS